MATCEERIDAVLKSTMADLETLWNLYSDDPEADHPNLGNWCEYGLGFDYVAANTFDDQPEGYFLYPRARGGPSDEFRFYAKSGYRGWEVSRIEYWFMDWFDGASRDVTDKSVLSEIFDWFSEVGACDNALEQAGEV